MIYDWFKIFNLTEFNAAGLVSREYVLELEDIGQKSILVTKGDLVSVLYDDVFLSLNLNAHNPFEFENHAVYLDPLTNDVHLGVNGRES